MDIKTASMAAPVLYQVGQGMKIGPEQIEAFLMCQENRGRRTGTLMKYRHDLTLLYQFLPEDKTVVPGTLRRWRDHLTDQDYAIRTVNSCISAANSFLSYLGRRDLQLLEFKLPDDVQPELTRQEYLRLLQTARSLDKERLYLLIKLFGSTGYPAQALKQLTVEAVRAGEVNLDTAKESPQYIRLPRGLRGELLDYTLRQGLLSGPVFVTRDGKPLSRSNASDSIKRLGHDAQVQPEKATPRCLQKLYQSTRASIRANVERLADQAYDHLLETEQLSIGWDEPGGEVSSF